MTIQKPENRAARISRIIFWACGIVLISLSIWCLYLAAKFGLWAIRLETTPIDMRATFFVSSCIAMVFFSFLCISGIMSIRQVSTLEDAGGLTAFHLTLPKSTALIVLIALSVLALSEYQATTKITWEESRGIPLAFLTVTETRGPCLAGAAFWKCRFVEDFHPLQLIANAMVIYYAVCVSSQAVQEFRGGG